MKQVAGIWVPDQEVEIVQYLLAGPMVDGKGTYQARKYFQALKHVETCRAALDIGAHVGTWSRLMALHFETVLAFEPVAEHCELWHLNVTADNATLIQTAVGDRRGTVIMKSQSGHSGHTVIDLEGGGDIPISRLDDLIADQPIDFIKIDVEGFELYAVRGGERVIRSNKPVMIIEQKPNGLAEHYGNRQFDARDLLVSWGAEEQFNVGNDICLTW